jgi:hypothetical protein
MLCWSQPVFNGTPGMLARVFPDGLAAGYLPPILNIFVLHTEQKPVRAFLPFFIEISFASFISLFCLHLKQYASILSPSIYGKLL